MSRPDDELMQDALARETDAQRALLAGDRDGAGKSFAAAAQLYRESWEAAAPGSFGRLIGMLKAAVLAGRADEAARYAQAALPSPGDPAWESPTSAYARALAELIGGEDDAAITWASRMREGPPAFARTAEAIIALAGDDRAGYEQALSEIVRDFEQRTEHLTGVAIADTALMLQRLAAERGLRAAIESDVLPPETDGDAGPSANPSPRPDV